MRDEDLDWKVYRMLERCGSTTIGEIAESTGEDQDRVAGSIDRLERNLLVERRGDAVRLLSIDESILRCQVKYSLGSMLTMEDGVIKIKKEDK